MTSLAKKSQTPGQRARRLRALERREHMLSVRIERKLMERLRYAAWEENTSPSDKARCILDAALPASA